MKEELLKGLTEEQVEKVKACKNQDELLAIAKEEGIELTDEQLEAVSGGCGFSSLVCPRCGSTDVNYHMQYSGYSYICGACDYHWDSTRGGTNN